MADLLNDCGYDLEDFEVRRKPSGACVAFIRERLHLANTRGILTELINDNGYGRFCVGELLELSDDELPRLFAGWASRERHGLFAQLADLLIISALQAEYLCPSQQRVQG